MNGHIHKTTYVSSIVYTLRNVQLCIGKSGKKAWYRASGSLPFIINQNIISLDNGRRKKKGLPTTHDTRKITIGQLSLQSFRPVFTTNSMTSINHSPIPRVDISSWTGRRSIYDRGPATNRLARELGFIETKLTSWNQSITWLVWRWWWDWGRCDICW